MLDITINTEIDLIQLLKSSSSTSSNDIEIRGWDIIHQNDTPENIALSPTLDPKIVSHLLKRLEFANLDQGADIDEFTKFDHWQTKVNSGTVHFFLFVCSFFITTVSL